jgi:signal peptidase I
MSRPNTRPMLAVFAAALIAVIIKAFVLDAAVVEGNSMLPLLQPGSVVLVLRSAYGLRAPFGRHYFFRWSEPKSGDIVAAISPLDGGPVVKRVFEASDGYYFLRGENPDESLDSRNYGAVPIEAVRGKVIFFFGWKNR